MPQTTAITFILAGKRLVTVRYAEPRAFPLFLQRVEKGDLPCAAAAAIMIGLIEAIIHREADLIERIQDDVDRTAPTIFEIKGGQQTRTRRLDVILKTVGKQGDINARAQESALSIDRVLTYFAHAARERKDDPSILTRIEVAHRDVSSLMEHMRFLSSRIAFLLDATLGMISTEQNQIIKLFSVAAVMLMPPTLIASIYGMNFKHMPELEWPFGYPMALVRDGDLGGDPVPLFQAQGLAVTPPAVTPPPACAAQPRKRRRSPASWQCRDGARTAARRPAPRGRGRQGRHWQVRAYCKRSGPA